MVATMTRPTRTLQTAHDEPLDLEAITGALCTRFSLVTRPVKPVRRARLDTFDHRLRASGRTCAPADPWQPWLGRIRCAFVSSVADGRCAGLQGDGFEFAHDPSFNEQWQEVADGGVHKRLQCFPRALGDEFGAQPWVTGRQPTYNFINDLVVSHLGHGPMLSAGTQGGQACSPLGCRSSSTERSPAVLPVRGRATAGTMGRTARCTGDSALLDYQPRRHLYD